MKQLPVPWGSWWRGSNPESYRYVARTPWMAVRLYLARAIRRGAKRLDAWVSP